MKGLSAEGLWGGPFYWGPESLLSNAVEWASVSVEAPVLGNMEGRSILRAFEINKYMKGYVTMPCKQVFISSISLHRGPVGEP
jgi:hypothetical protein